jgi:hypothetical protein
MAGLQIQGKNLCLETRNFKFQSTIGMVVKFEIGGYELEFKNVTFKPRELCVCA